MQSIFDHPAFRIIYRTDAQADGASTWWTVAWRDSFNDALLVAAAADAATIYSPSGEALVHLQAHGAEPTGLGQGSDVRGAA